MTDTAMAYGAERNVRERPSENGRCVPQASAGPTLNFISKESDFGSHYNK